MSNDNASSSNSSFSHAFLPGLILGIIIGAVAATFLPVLTGPKIPQNSGASTTAGTNQDLPRDHRDDGHAPEEDIQALIDEAEQNAEEVIDEAAENLPEDLPTDLPTDPPSDG